MCARERASGFADLCVGCDGLLEDGEGARRELLLLRLLLPFLDRRGAHGGVTRHGCWRAPLFRVCACRPRGKTHTRGGFSFAFPFSFFDFGFNILTARKPLRQSPLQVASSSARLHACTALRASAERWSPVCAGLSCERPPWRCHHPSSLSPASSSSCALQPVPPALRELRASVATLRARVALLPARRSTLPPAVRAPGSARLLLSPPGALLPSAECRGICAVCLGARV